MKTDRPPLPLNRRDALKLGLAGSAALFLPMERIGRTQRATDNRIPESRLPEPFRVPFAVPPVARPYKRDATTDYYRITQQQAQVQILPGDFGKTVIYGYNGITPGPTIAATKGRKVWIAMLNRLPEESFAGYRTWTSCHLHGSASLPQYDGYASDITQPDQWKPYRYPNIQPARTLWYHDHGVHHTAENAYMGLAAQYHLHDRQELALPIPHGKYDVPLIIQDKLFAQDGGLIFDDNDQSGQFGDVILVNGRPWPTMKVARRRYRFRILNASLSRSYRLALSTGDAMTVIGTDGGLMPAPQTTQELRLGQAERYEVVIDFAAFKAGDQVILENLSNRNNVDYASTAQIMRFDVGDGAIDRKNNAIPDVLNPGSGQKYNPMGLKEADATGRAELEVTRKNGLWTINGQTWEEVIASGYRQVVANPGLDEVQVWTLKNPSGGWFHPLHVHLIDFRILDRNGQPPEPYERGPKDVAYLGENETVRVLARFGPQQGRYMVHCHNLVHEDHDMMVQFRVGTDDRLDGLNDPVEGDPARDGSPPRPPRRRTPRRRPAKKRRGTSGKTTNRTGRR